ncbi:hypothetical protein ACGFZJ_39220 [Streptomyces sp. NPDC048253]
MPNPCAYRSRGYTYANGSGQAMGLKITRAQTIGLMSTAAAVILLSPG